MQTLTLPNITLYYREGSSDKVYQCFAIQLERQNAIKSDFLHGVAFLLFRQFAFLTELLDQMEKCPWHKSS